MEAISELSHSLSHYFSWHKSRMDCLCKIIFAIISVQTVNLATIATVLYGTALSSSHYKRLQRFFRWLSTEKGVQSILQKLTLRMLGLNNVPLIYLAMDRTNWKLGKIHINLLVLGIRYHGINIPLTWISLGKAGTSSTTERISLLKRFMKVQKGRLFVLTADREFVGEDWFKFLKKKRIPFVIRIKENTHVRRPECEHAVPAKDLFKRLRKKRKTALNGLHEVYGIPVFIAAARNQEGELLIVVSNQFCRKAIKEYLKRWGIECLFSCLKVRGFNLEDTHITEPSRISALFFVLVIVFVWSMRTGVNTRKQFPTKRAAHGRKRASIFRRGLDALKRCIIHLHTYFERLMRFVDLFSEEKPLRNICEGGF